MRKNAERSYFIRRSFPRVDMRFQHKDLFLNGIRKSGVCFVM